MSPSLASAPFSDAHTSTATLNVAKKTDDYHLGMLAKGEFAIVTELLTQQNPADQATRMRLLELGFAPGIRVRVVAVSFPQGDPMAIRVGNTTFALRRHEAAMIGVSAPQDHPR